MCRHVLFSFHGKVRCIIESPVGKMRSCGRNKSCASIKYVVFYRKADYSAANNSKFSVPRSAPFTISVTEWMPG